MNSKQLLSQKEFDKILNGKIIGVIMQGLKDKTITVRKPSKYIVRGTK